MARDATDDGTLSELSSILESSRDLVIRYDRDIRVLFFNSAADRIYRDVLGVSLEVGMCTYDLFPPEQRRYWDGINARVLGGESFTEELALTDHQGAPRVYEIDYRPTRRGGEVVGFTTFARDVTDARAQERALREKDKLESIGALAGGLAHDFNNLLVAMLGNISMALDELPPSEPATQHLLAAQEAALRAADLTRQMLTYAGRAPAVVEPVDLRSLVQDMVQLLRTSVPRNVTLELSAEPAWVLGDRAQLQQVVMNLVTNAGDAIGDRAGLVRVTVGRGQLASTVTSLDGSALPDGDHAVLTVVDDGCGMTEEVRARMFDPFFTTKSKGHGLGLSAMQGILRSHRAAIDIESSPREGTRIRVFIPAAAPDQKGKAWDTAPAARLSGVVLLADDEPHALGTTRAALERMGFHVVVACDGNDAMEKASPILSDLSFALLDLTMPGSGGADVARLLQARRRDLPVILTSGFARRDVSGLLRDGVTHFLAKPFTFAELRATVSRLIGPEAS